MQKVTGGFHEIWRISRLWTKQTSVTAGMEATVHIWSCTGKIAPTLIIHLHAHTCCSCVCDGTTKW